MNFEANAANMPGIMHPQGNSGGAIAICNKHDQVISVYCTIHALPLCVHCTHEHVNSSNTRQNASKSGAPEHNLVNITKAIVDFMTRMQNDLMLYHDFIEFKKGIRNHNFSDDSSLSTFLTQNQIFEDAANTIQNIRSNFQNMSSGQQAMNLSLTTLTYNNEIQKMAQARSNIESIFDPRLAMQQQPQIYQQSTMNRGAFESMNNQAHQTPQVPNQQQAPQQQQPNNMMNQNTQPAQNELLQMQMNMMKQPTTANQQSFQGAFTQQPNQHHIDSQNQQQNQPLMSMDSHQQQTQHPLTLLPPPNVQQQDDLNNITNQNQVSPMKQGFEDKMSPAPKQEHVFLPSLNSQLLSGKPITEPLANIIPGLPRQESMTSIDLQEANPELSSNLKKSQSLIQSRKKHWQLKLQVVVENLMSKTLQPKIVLDLEVDSRWKLRNLRQRVQEEILPKLTFESQDQAEKCATQIYNMKIYQDSSQQELKHVSKSLEHLDVRDGDTLTFTDLTRGVSQQVQQQQQSINLENQAQIDSEYQAKLPSIQQAVVASTGPKTSAKKSKAIKDNGTPSEKKPRSAKKYTPKENVIVTLLYRIRERQVASKNNSDQDDQIDHDQNFHEDHVNYEEEKHEPEQHDPENHEPPAMDENHNGEQMIDTNAPVQQEVQDQQQQQQQQQQQYQPKEFSRQVQIGLKTRLRALRDLLIEDLGLQKICKIRIFDSQSQQELTNDMCSLESLGLQNLSQIEVELYQSINISVPRKGKGYQVDIEVDPLSSMDTMRSKVHFFKQFVNTRKYQIFSPELEKVFQPDQLSTLLFRDSGLVHGSALTLREPPLKQQTPIQPKVEEQQDQEHDDDEEEEEDELDAEAGEDEMEEQEAEMSELDGHEDAEIEMEEQEHEQTEQHHADDQQPAKEQVDHAVRQQQEHVVPQVSTEKEVLDASDKHYELAQTEHQDDQQQVNAESI